MSLRSLGVRRVLATAGLGTLAATAALASSAQAVTLKQEYSCEYPLIGVRGLTVEIDAAIPAEWPKGKPTDKFTINAKASTDLATYDGLNLISAQSFGGTSIGNAVVTLPGGFNLPVAVPLNVPETQKPATRGPIVLNVNGETPELTFPTVGDGVIKLSSISLNLTAKKADGTLIQLPPVGEDSDGDPNTFDVACTLKAGQPDVLQNIKIVNPAPTNTAPTKPGVPTVTGVNDVTSTSAKIKWTAATDDKAVTAYIVKYDDVSIELPGNVTETTLTGLLPDSEYTITVTAKDAEGLTTESDPGTVITLPSTDELPSTPTGLKTTEVKPNSVSLSWNASTDDKGVKGYDVYKDGVKVANVTGTTATITGLNPETAYKFKVLAIDTADQTSTFSDELSVTTPAPPDEPPTAPTGVKGTATTTSVELSWTAATDDKGISGYDVYQNGTKVKTVTGTSTTITGLTPNTDYKFKVQASDTKPQTGPFSSEITVKTLAEPPADTPPTAPTGLKGTAATTSVALSWTAATDDKGISGYDVYKDGAKVATVTGTSATVSGLAPSTEYKFKVQATDTKPQTGPFSTEITVKTLADSGEPTVDYSYGLTGSSKINTLTKGNVPLSGAFDAKLTLATGAFTGDLTLNNTRARLNALGFIPVTADVAFVMTDKVTGKLENGKATATAKFKIRLPKVYLFGSIPLSNSSQCQTKSASTANLSSVGSFDPLAGGRLTGSYAISNLTGCGAFTALLSPLTAGGGNTIDVTLAAKPPAAS